MSARKHPRIEHHVLPDGYWLSLGRTAETSSLHIAGTMHGDRGRHVATGTITSQAAELREGRCVGISHSRAFHGCKHSIDNAILHAWLLK